MYTSYFAKVKTIESNLEPIAICLYPPKWYNGKTYKALAPTWDILDDWKKGRQDKEAEEYYERMYYKKILNKLDAEKVFNELGENAVLLCFEKSSDFCHRHIVAKWFMNELGIIVPEYLKKDNKEEKNL